MREFGLCQNPGFLSVCCRRQLEAWRCYCSCSELSLSWETVQQDVMHVAFCRSTRILCQAWSTSSNHSGKEWRVRRRFHLISLQLRLHLQKLLTLLLSPSLMCSWQVGLHGRQLRAQTRRGIRVPHHHGGVAQRDAGPRHLQHQVQVHRRRQTRSSLLGVEPHYQERLERLIPLLAIDVFLCFVPLSFSRCHSIISVWIHLWIMCWFKLSLSPSTDTRSHSFLF